jgi:membrane protein
MSQTSTRRAEKVAEKVPGGSAEQPTQIPPKGWLQIAKRGWAEAKADQVPLLAAGVAYYAFMALFPALVAAVLLYGLFADPATIADQVGQVTEALPAQARDLIITQLQTLSQQDTGAGIGVAVSILLALWGASGGVGNLMTAISTAYDEEEKRSFLKKRLLALALTLGAIIFMVIVLSLVAVFPAVIQLVGGGPLAWLLQALRWVVLALAVAVALAVLYRVAPDRDAPKMKWASTGAIIATVLWILASVGFSLYVANFSNYAKTYGAVAGIVVLLLWLFITCYAILLGAEINAEAEQQTVADTTRGPQKPLGQRGAVKADSLPDAPEAADTQTNAKANSGPDDADPKAAQAKASRQR